MARSRALTAIPLSMAAGLTILVAEAAIAFRGDAAVDPPGSPDAEFGPEDAPRLNLVVLGDSSGSGAGAESHDFAFPRLCARALAERTGRRVVLNVLAVGGARVRDVLREQVPLIEQMHPDLVLLVVGGNDVSHMTPLLRVRKDLRQILDRVAATGAKVVVSGVPAMGAVIRMAQPLRATAGLAARLYERVWRDETARRGIVYAPMAAEIGPAFRANPLLLSFDGFHPSARGYALWADCFNRYIEKVWPTLL